MFIEKRQNLLFSPVGTICVLNDNIIQTYRPYGTKETFFDRDL